MPSPGSPQIHASDQKGTLHPTRPATLIGKLSQPVQHVLRHPLLESTALTSRTFLLKCCSGSAWWPLGDGVTETLPHELALAGLLCP